MDTELVLLLFSLFVGIIIAIFFVGIIIAIFLRTERVIQAVKDKTYTVGVRAKLRKNENEWVFERLIDLEIPPAVGQIIQFEGGFEIIDVLPSPLESKCCCILNCEMLTAENFNVNSYIENLLKHSWQLDKLLSDPLPKDFKSKYIES